LSTIDYHSPLSVFISVKGHPYQRDDFFDIFESMQGVRYTAVEQPASQQLMSPEGLADYQALLLYDMPGIDFSTQPPSLVVPSDSFKQNFMALLQSGKGIVFLHHAVAGWPMWPEYADVVGGRFWYIAGDKDGQHYEDSGYRHDVAHRVSKLADHVITANVPDSFDITDELYLFDCFDDDKQPLLSSDYSFDNEHFYSAAEAVAHGKMYSRENWARTSGTHLVGWVKSYKNSPVVFLQMGDGPTSYENKNFRTLLQNALQWVASDEAHQWARQRNTE